MKRLLALIMSFCVATVASANDNEIKGRVIQVLDGNTLILKSEDNEDVKIILFGIDCPELGQPYGKEAKKCLEKLLLEKNVVVQINGMNRSGAYLGIIATGTKKQIDPRIKLLEEGLAWTTENNPLPDLESHRLEAQQKGVGLWKHKEPTPPWVYRRQQSMTTPKFS